MIADPEAAPEATKLAVAMLDNPPVRREEARRLRASINDFLTWAHHHLDLVKAFEEVPDGRDAARTRIPLAAILFAIFLMFLLGLPSIRALDDRLARSPYLRRVLGLTGWSGSISDDAFAEALGRLDDTVLRSFLHRQGLRELKRWRAGRYRQSELAQRLAPVGVKCPGLLTRALVAIDGHELFSSEHRRCPQCLTRIREKERDGQTVEVPEYYHSIVVAQWVGVHPAIVLDFETVKPKESELTAAYRLAERLGKVYGQQIGTVVVDGLYTGRPFRKLLHSLAYAIVVRLKSREDGAHEDPGWWLDEEAALQREPSQRYSESGTRTLYETWEVPAGKGLRLIRVHRTRKVGEHKQIQDGACITDLPLDPARPVAVALMMETRWWIEDTGFHELAGPMHLDRAFVHVGRPTAARAIVTLAFLAYNALQSYVYRHLGLNPKRPKRTMGDIKRDLFETLAQFRCRRSFGRAPPAPV